VPNFNQIKSDLINNVDHSRFVSSFSGCLEKLSFGDFLLSAISTTGEQTLGYVVQIRKDWGQFGSDMIFIRDQNGSLATHENQGFWILTNEQIKLVMPFFQKNPSDEMSENPDLEYSISKSRLKSGFIVDSDHAPTRIDSCAISISVTNNDGGFN